MTIEERVRAGAALLDARGPADWRERIDLDGLDIECADDCVLGQVFVDLEDEDDDTIEGSGYLVGIKVLRLHTEDAIVRAGFESVPFVNENAELTDAWRAYLSGRG